MSLDTTAYEEDIIARLRTLCPRVYEPEVPDTIATPQLPYVLVRWMEPVRTGFDHHMVGVRDDTMRGGMIVTAVSLTPDDARRLKNRIKSSLVGYRPPDCDEIKPEGGLAYSTANNDPKPATYAREMYFTFHTNMTSNDSVE